MAGSWEHLLGGYATNTLTEEEKRRLFEAALHDQALFEALADEEALKAMLADPEARRRILESLEAKQNPDDSSEGRGGRRNWFWQQSSLAWAGSIAAVGLALIFGWQMEKEWGSVVSQEQEAGRSFSGDEEAIKTKKPLEEKRTSIPKDVPQKEMGKTEGVKSEPQTPPTTAPRLDADSIHRLPQVSAMAKKEGGAREQGQPPRRQRAMEQLAQEPALSAVPGHSRSGMDVPPSTIPEPREIPGIARTPQAPAPTELANRPMEESPHVPLTARESAQELFYAASGSLADEVIADKHGKELADHAPRDGLAKELKPSSRKKLFSFRMEQESGGAEGILPARGIRYSFVRDKKDGGEEEIESRKFGDWHEIRLALEANVSGFLYVSAPLGNGKWQQLMPVPSTKLKTTDVGIEVKPYQRVEFLLAPVMNEMGKPAVSLLTVLLSPEPLDDLGQWLGKEADVDGLLIERETGAVFVVEHIPNLEKPLRLEILFGTDGKH